MAEIKTSDIINSSELTTDLQKIIDKFNELLGILKQNAGEFQKAAGSTKKLTEAEKEAAEIKKKQVIAEKELIAEKKKLEAINLKQVAALEKQAQKQKEINDAAYKEVKTLGDLNAKLAARRKLIQDLEMGTDAYNEMAISISELAKQQDVANTSLRIFNQRVGNYQAAADSVNMSLGEMKKELRELRNMSFANLNPEEIAQIRDRMAELTDQIGDFQSQIRTASADRIPALMDGLQGLVAVAQGVTGTLAIFGVETEKLDKAMVQLIGVSQALKTIQELQEKGTLRVAWATVKDTAAKAANAVAAKGQAMATTGATSATRALGKAMMTNPYTAIIAGAVALAAILAVVIIKMQNTANTAKIVRKANEEASQSIGKERAALESLLMIAKDTTLSLESRKHAIEEINKISPEYLGNITLENIGTAESTELIDKYIDSLERKAQAQAYNNLMAEQYTKLSQEQMKTYESLTIAEKGYYEALGISSRISGSAMYELERSQKIAGIYDEIDAIKSLIKFTEDYETVGLSAAKVLNIDTKIKEDVKTTVNNANTAYNSYLEAIKKANEEAKISIALGEDEIRVRVTEQQAIFNAAKAYYELNGYTSEEIRLLQVEMEKLTELQKLLTEFDENALKRAILTPIKEIGKEVVDTTTDFKALWDIANSFDPSKLVAKPTEKNFFESLTEGFITFKNTVARNAEALTQLYSGITDGISGAFDNQITKQQLAADANAKYYENLLSHYDQDSAEYAQTLALKEQAQAQYQAKLAELEKKKAIFDKTKALIDIAISTAKGIIAALAGPPSNPFLATAIGITGAIQAGVVASQPLPQYYVGLDSADRDHIGSVAERGSELVNYPDGTSELFTKPTITFIPKYTSIDTAEETAKKLKSMQFTVDLTQMNNNSRESLKYLGVIARNTAGRQTATDIHYLKKYAV